MTTIDSFQARFAPRHSRKAIAKLIAVISDIRDGQRALYGKSYAASYDDAFEAPYDRVVKSDAIAAISLMR